ncbi:hypothetical protein GYMLUDRAFT_51004 [Collybiopsis luxurians FD-317 M1]|uniref:Uncharacterized protein n=1 Tax=Collybiopsis luxurians FD-317 M1 TaxID=944289 RepID=A0A0D0BZF8_9AGAR|nr:hypothetical protein GYMLUDRAFT_51004 [Collybiopsis luxurians FD-317 M1]
MSDKHASPKPLSNVSYLSRYGSSYYVLHRETRRVYNHSTFSRPPPPPVTEVTGLQGSLNISRSKPIIERFTQS